MRRGGEDGVVLINVLVLLALAATVVYTMLSLAEISIARSQRFSEAGQALALIRGGEQSAIVALRRDMEAAPDIDHPSEPWGSVAQVAVGIEGGGFELAIADAQGLFNLNALIGGGLQAEQTLREIVAALELEPETATRISEGVARRGPLLDLDDLAMRAGIAPEAVELLRGYVTALPGRADVNLNAAPTELLTILLRNPVHARVLAAKRDRFGFVTPEDVTAAGAILPPGVGFVSDLFRVRTSVRIGGTAQSMQSLLQRRRGTGGVPEVAVVMRRNATAAVSPPPPSM